MKRLSELQYISRMQGEQSPIEPADVTAGDMMDDDIFGEYATPIEEPADVTTGDMAGTPYESYDDEFFEPADVTPGDMYENIILTEANPFRKRKRVREENVDTVDYKGYTITVHRNGAGMYTAKNDYGEPYSNVPQFKTAKEAIAWDKKNLDELVDELDESTHISEKYGVYSKGGSIGSKNDEPVKVFDTAEEAKDYAKRMRKLLTPGERSHYKMGYITKPIKEASTRWHVRIPANVYDGRYYDYRYVAVVAPGETAADAVAYVKAHPEEFIAKIDGMRAGNKRKVKKPTEKNIWIEKAFAGSKIVEAHSHSPSAEFSNEFSITVKDAKKLARTYGCEWDTEGDEWEMIDVDEHVFTYLPKQGKLFTDFDQDQVIEMIEEPLQGVRESKDEVKLTDLEDELDKWESVANKSDKEAVTKRKELKKEIAALKKKIGLKEATIEWDDIPKSKQRKIAAIQKDLETTVDEERKEELEYLIYELEKPYLKEGVIPPSELVDPDSEFSITDEHGNIPDDLASVGNYRNPDNEINQMEDMFGRDTAVDMLAYRNSLKQRMHKHLFDTHEWDAEDDQSDWDGKIDYFYGDLHDNYSDEEEWNDDEAREVARTHMYGHPRWDENATKLDCLRLEEALLYYSMTESKMKEFGPLTGPARGSSEEPIRRNSNGWEKHPDEPDFDDDMYDDYDMEPDDFFDDDIAPSDRDDEDDIYDDIDEFDYDEDVWFPESKRKLKESVEDDILAKVIINIDENYTEDTIGDDQIYFYFSQVFNDSYYPESEEEIPEIVEELTHKIFAARDDDQEEDQDFDDDNYGFMESGKRLIENGIVNEIMAAVDDLVEKGVGIEAAKAEVAGRYSDSFNADDLYEILYNDYSDSYDEDDIF